MVVLLFILTMFSTISWAAPTKSCFLSSVKTISVPVYPDRLSSPRFNYSFQYYPPKAIGAPTIVVVPGGPGVGLISDWSDSDMQKTLQEMGLPKDAGLIFPDPRTVDCNWGDETLFPDDALRTEYLANDLLSAIEHVKVNHYILYGHSYGSVLATVMASMAEKKGMIRPTAVVLTGVVGRWVSGPKGSVYQGLTQQWARLKNQLPPNINQRFAQDDFPLALTNKAWGEIIENGLYTARVMMNKKLHHPLREALQLLARNNSRDNKKALALIKTFHDFEQPTLIGDPKWSTRLFQVMDCAELTDTEPTQTIKAGELVITGNDCEGREKLTRPFDSADWQITAPIFYISGTSEAVTPYWQARLHLQSQKSSERFFVSVIEGGHNRIGLYYDDCKEGLWKSIAGGGQGFEGALMNCHALTLMKQERHPQPLFEFVPAQ